MSRIVRRTLLGIALCGVAFGAIAENNFQEEGLTIFLADPELGVVGSYNVDDSVVYFEARDAGPGGIAARLLDENGQEIAVAGGANLESWGHPDYQPEAAMQSQYAVGQLAKAMALAMSATAIAPEQLALTELAQEVAFADLSEEPFYPRRAKTLTSPEYRVAVDDFYQGAGSELSLTMNKQGNGLTGKYRGVELTAFTEEFTDEVDDNGDPLPPRQEVYARIAVDGRVVDSTFGGDLIPAGWGHESEHLASDSSGNPYEQIGRAVMAAQVLSKSIDPESATTSLELATLIEMGRSMRDYILPVPLTEIELEEFDGQRDGLSHKRPEQNYKTYAAIWRKPLITGNFTGRHSGLRQTHWKRSGGSKARYDHRHNFCNHGACPGASSMSLKCKSSGGWIGNWRHAGSCSTSYGICLGGNKHNCHDDTARQLRLINAGITWASNDGRCSSYFCARYEAGCNHY